MSWALRTIAVDDVVSFDGWRVRDRRLIEDSHGSLLWLRNPPAQRRWTEHGVLARDEPIRYELTETANGACLRVDRPAEVDLVELANGEAQAFQTDRSDPMTVLGSFAPLGDARTLGRFLVGESVLDTTDFGGRRCPSEQTALSLYRIARHRSGPFWDAVAVHLAAWAAERVEEAPGGQIVHDLWGRGETHVRFLADAVLLLLAEADRGDRRARSAADRGLDALETFAVPWGSGSWYRHDSVERDEGRNDLVLNTHAQCVLVHIAGGRPVHAATKALETALELRGAAGRRRLLGLALAGTSIAAGRSRRLARRAVGPSHRIRAAAARSHVRQPALRLPGGWIERDVTPAVGATYYFTVNLLDLAALVANVQDPSAARALRAGLTLGRAGAFRQQEHLDEPTTVLHPVILRLTGHRRSAQRTARRLAEAGVRPTIGWPGVTDELWTRLVPGTP